MGMNFSTNFFNGTPANGNEQNDIKKKKKKKKNSRSIEIGSISRSHIAYEVFRMDVTVVRLLTSV